MRIQLISITALASLTVLSANSQTAGASAGSGISVGGPAPVVPALQPRQAVTPPVPPTQLPSGQVPSSTAQQTTPGLGTSTTTTGAGPGAGTTTGVGTGANEISSTTANPIGGTTQDQAVTAADQEVLAQVRQRVIIPGGNPWGPVHFSVANGVVTITGQAQSPAAQQQLEALVKSTPGVVAVMNQLNSTSPTAGTVTTSGNSGTTTAPLTSGGLSVAGAMSPADQILLLRVRQSVIPQIQVAGQPVPVNFTVQQGVVTVNGSVTSLAQKRQIAALVQQVPGVSQVSDQIRVGSTLPQTTLGATGTAAAVGQTTTGPDGNLTPTGRPNGAALPQGLQRRTDLPPGLQRRGTLPPGLTEGTNGSGTIR